MRHRAGESRRSPAHSASRRRKRPGWRSTARSRGWRASCCHDRRGSSPRARRGGRRRDARGLAEGRVRRADRPGTRGGPATPADRDPVGAEPQRRGYAHGRCGRRAIAQSDPRADARSVGPPAAARACRQWRLWDVYAHGTAAGARGGAEAAECDRAADPSSNSPVIAEGRRLARLRHPNVIDVTARHARWPVGFWMEFLEGQTLKQWFDTTAR